MGTWSNLKSNTDVHKVACFYAAAEAIVQGHHVDIKDEVRRYRLLVNGVFVQVQAQRAGAWQSDVAHPLADDTQGVIFVDLSGELPDFYIAPADWVRSDIAHQHKAFMDRVGGTRPRNPASTHHAIDVSRIAKWHLNWNVLNFG
jgi:hypothetical protein